MPSRRLGLVRRVGTNACRDEGARAPAAASPTDRTNPSDKSPVRTVQGDTVRTMERPAGT